MLVNGFAAQVGALKELGPDYQSTFMATESDPAFEQAESAANLLIHGKEAIGSMLALSYNAQVSIAEVKICNVRKSLTHDRLLACKSI